MKEKVTTILAAVVFIVMVCAFIYFATSKEVYCADMHDSQCEFTDNCGCYERLMETEKN